MFSSSDSVSEARIRIGAFADAESGEKADIVVVAGGRSYSLCTVVFSCSKPLGKVNGDEFLGSCAVVVGGTYLFFVVMYVG